MSILKLRLSHGSPQSLAVALLCLALAALAIGVSGSPSASAAAKSKRPAVSPPSDLISHGKLTTGTDFTYPPYETITNGHQVGFDVAFTKDLAAEMGLKPNMIDTRFASLIPGLQANHFDAIISALYITAARAKVVTYIPYFDTGNSLVVRKSEKYRPTKPRDLCGHSVAVLAGSDIENIIQTQVAPKCRQHLSLSSFPTDTQAFQDVAAGNADVLATDAAVGKDRVDHFPKLKMVISSKTLLYPVPVGLAVRKGDTAMQNALQHALARLKATGAFQHLLKRYGLAPANSALVRQALGK